MTILINTDICRNGGLGSAGSGGRGDRATNMLAEDDEHISNLGGDAAIISTFALSAPAEHLKYGGCRRMCACG